MIRTRPALLVVAAVLVVAALVVAAPRVLRASPEERAHAFAVTGDIPYTDEQVRTFPDVVAQINADPEVQWVSHLGDFKSGFSECSDDYFRLIKNSFDDVADPLVYTPGDNEWSDCHRPETGSYDPLERLRTLREVFFARPGQELADAGLSVVTQERVGLPENVRWSQAGITFATLHVVGGNNALASWTGNTRPTPEQTAEVIARTAGAIEALHDTFAEAREEDSRGVVLMMQADMFAPDSDFGGSFAFQSIVAALARESADLGRPVYLFNGDTHVYAEARPLNEGSPWLQFYDVEAAPNVRQVTIGGDEQATGYLRVTVGDGDGDGEVLTWTTVPFGR